MKCQINRLFLLILIWAMTYFGCGEDSFSPSVQQAKVPQQKEDLQKEEDPQLGTVSGIITDATTGNPIPGATVHLLDQTVETGADGRYVFTQIGYAEALNLAVTDVDYEPKTHGFELSVEHLPLNISLIPNFGAVSGIITDATTGNSIPGVTVNLLNQTVETETDGRYIFTQIAYSEALSLTVVDADYKSKTQVFELRTDHFLLNIPLTPLTNPEAEIQQFLDSFSALIESMDMDNLEAIQAHFSETYLAGDDPVTRFGLATGVIPARFEEVIPSISKLFEKFDAIQFRFQNIQVDVTHSREASARLTLDVISEQGPRPDRKAITVECRMDFRKEGLKWKVVFWQLFKVEVLL
jgi:hypothetical protein